VPQHIRDKQPFACIQLLCELANINITKAWAETKSSERNPFLLQANNVIDRARVLDPTDQLVHLSSAHLSFAQVCVPRPYTCQCIAQVKGTKSCRSHTALYIRQCPKH
jgi:hypothetical protein